MTWRLHSHWPIRMLSSERGRAKAMIEFSQDLLGINGFGCNVDAGFVFSFYFDQCTTLQRGQRTDSVWLKSTQGTL